MGKSELSNYGEHLIDNIYSINKYNSTNMQTAHWRIFGIGLTCLIFLAICSGNDDVDEMEYDEYSEYEQSSGHSYEQPTIASFSFESNVRDYLSSHRFTSYDGYTITFLGGMSEMYVNGQIFSGYTEIVNFSRNSAVLRANGPTTRITLYLDAANGVLTERSNGTKYYAK